MSCRRLLLLYSSRKTLSIASFTPRNFDKTRRLIATCSPLSASKSRTSAGRKYAPRLNQTTGVDGNLIREENEFINAERSEQDLTRLCETADKLTDAVVEQRLKINVKVTKNEASREICYDVVVVLLKSKIPEGDISEILPKHYGLLSHPVPVWEETIAYLKNYQFSPAHVLPLLAACPSLLQGAATVARKKLFDLLTFFRGQGLTEGRMHQVVVQNPQLLRKNLLHIVERYTQLLKIFTKAELHTLLCSNTGLLSDSLENIEKKIDYVFNTMGIKSAELVKSRLFSHSYEHIVARHAFLERAGLYAKPNPRDENAKSMNLSLTQIIDTTDKSFVKKVKGGLTVLDYETFVKMVHLELEEAAKDEEDENSDSDDEDSDSE